jgi:uncharacterized membrane protein
MRNIAQNLKNPLTWVYLFSFTKVFLAAVGIEVAPEQWELWEQVVNAACGILVALGIFSFNPFDKRSDINGNQTKTHSGK